MSAVWRAKGGREAAAGVRVGDGRRAPHTLCRGCRALPPRAAPMRALHPSACARVAPAPRWALRRSRAPPPPPRAAPGPPPPSQDDEEAALLLADLERYGGAAPRGGPDTPTPTPTRDPRFPPPKPQPPSSAAQDALDKLLIADFFFVLAALAWLVAGVGAQAAGAGSGVADAWFLLWPGVFQPAIGLLMAGALASGGMGWWRGRSEGGE